MTTEQALYQVQSIIHVSTTLAAVIILVNIWFNYYQRKVKSFHKTPRDYGLLFLCAGLMVWASISLLSIANPGTRSTLGIGIISSLNNGFFMASFAYFKHGLEWFSIEKNRNYWIVAVGIVSISVILTVCIIDANTNAQVPTAVAYKDAVIGYIDFAYTSLTALFLGGLLFKSFENRHLYSVAFVSLGVVFMAIYGQLLGVPNFPINPGPIHKVAVFCISHALMVAIFVSLAFSWVIENSEIIKEIKEDEIASAFLMQFEERKAEDVEFALKELVKRGEIYDAIVIAREYFKRKGRRKDKALEEMLSNLSGQLTSLNLENREGLVRREDYITERNRIRWALIKAIDEISEVDTTGEDGTAPHEPIVAE